MATKDKVVEAQEVDLGTYLAKREQAMIAINHHTNEKLYFEERIRACIIVSGYLEFLSVDWRKLQKAYPSK